MEIEQIKQAAKDGDAKSQFLLGRHYFAGHLIEQDFQQAKIWYEKAAQQNHAEALLNLGKLYEQGQAGTIDLAKAIDCYQRAADLDEPEAQYMLSLHYELGQGLERDSSKAFQWCRRAAEKNYAGAQYMLGSMYAAGQGVEADQSEARKWYRLAAENGYAAAQFAMGQLEETTSLSAAETWYKQAAELDFPPALYRLARLKMLSSDRGGALPFYEGVAFHLQELLDEGHISSIESEVKTCLQAADDACGELELEEAAQWAKLAILMTAKCDVRLPELAPQLVALGRFLQHGGLNDDAERIFVEALALLRDGSNEALCAELFGRLGQMYANGSDLLKADQTLREAVSSYETLGIENEQLAELLLALAVVQIKLEKQSAAVPLLRRCATLVEHYHGESSLLTQVLSIMGSACVSTGYMLVEAEQVYKRVLAILEANGEGDSADAAAVLDILGSLMDHAGRPEDAEAMRERAAAIKSKH